jgi:DNA helicase-2/ATP-dependent DNA helicase PcrA
VFTRHFSDTTIRFSARLFSTAHDFDLAFLDGMNEAQVKAVTQPLASITRVIAGPGAGKTRVLTSRIAYLLHNDDNSRILAVTFTKKAAGEMQERLEKLLMTTSKVPDHIEERRGIRENDIAQEEVADASGAAPRPSTALDRVTLGTFHSVCAKILRWNGKYLATLPSVVKDMIGVVNATSLDGSFAIIDQGDQVRLVKECADELGIDLKSQDLKPQTMLNAIAKIKSSLAMGQDPLNSGRKVPSKTTRVGAKLYPLYRQKLLTRNALDFDDLILMARELLTVHMDIRDHLRRRWQHVLVDEFQDTSQSQLDLVKLLSSDSLLVVGDADQSIYSWRGAHAESMSDFLHQFDDRLDGVNTVHLMENYR